MISKSGNENAISDILRADWGINRDHLISVRHIGPAAVVGYRLDGTRRSISILNSREAVDSLVTPAGGAAEIVSFFCVSSHESFVHVPLFCM